MEKEIMVTLTREELDTLNKSLYKNIEKLKSKGQEMKSIIECLEENKGYCENGELDSVKEFFEDISNELAQCDKLWGRLRAL